jgi:hypothetical protein
MFQKAAVTAPVAGAGVRHKKGLQGQAGGLALKKEITHRESLRAPRLSYGKR